MQTKQREWAEELSSGGIACAAMNQTTAVLSGGHVAGK